MRANSPYARRGVVLIDVLVALAVVGVLAVAASGLAVEAGETVRRAADADDEMRRASRFLDAAVLWTRADLDRRLGERRQGDWTLIVQRTSPTLFELKLADSTVTRELLRTVVYRRLSPPEARNRAY